MAVGHDHQGEPALVAQAMEQLDDLVLALAVEVAGRLVGQEQARVVGERPRDRDRAGAGRRRAGRDGDTAVGEARLPRSGARRARFARAATRVPSNIGIWMFSSAVNVGIR